MVDEWQDLDHRDFETLAAVAQQVTDRFRALERRKQMTIQQSTDAPETAASANLVSPVADAVARAADEVVAQAVVEVVQGAVTEN